MRLWPLALAPAGDPGPLEPRQLLILASETKLVPRLTYVEEQLEARWPTIMDGPEMAEPEPGQRTAPPLALAEQDQHVVTGHF